MPETITYRGRFGLLTLASAVLLVTSLPLSGESKPVPGSRGINDFELTTDWQFELAGELQADAEIYHSPREVAYLIVAPGLDRPLLVSPRGESVQAVASTAVGRETHSASLEGGSSIQSLGTYTQHGKAIHFEIGGQAAELKPRPPLLGNQSQLAVVQRSPQYAQAAEAYSLAKSFAPQQVPVDGERVRVRVYFGSWSEICGELVPKIMRVEEAWHSAGVRFEYYGVPQPITDDPVAVAEGILGVPTAIAYVDGEEIGRLSGRPLDTPETSLVELLSSAAE